MTKNLSIAMDQMDLRFLQLRSPTALAIRNMAHSIKKRGQLTPVVLVGEKKPYILVDGFKRYWGAQSLGLESLKAILIDVDLTKAKSMMYLMNRTVRLSFIQEAMLIRELVEQDGLKQTEVAELLDHHKSWVNRRLMIIRRLAPEILEDLRLELLPPGAVAVLARVALCNQGDFSAAIQRHGLCLKEIHVLTDIWCKAKEPAKKQFLLSFPKEALALVQEELAGLSVLQKAHNLLSTFKKRLDTSFQDPDSNDQLRSYLTQIKSEIHTINELKLFDGNGNLRDRKEAEENIEVGLSLIEELGHKKIIKAVNKVRRTMPGLLNYFDLAISVLEDLSSLPIHQEALKALCVAWQWGKGSIKSKKAKRRNFCDLNEDFCLEIAIGYLQDEYEVLKEQVYRQLDQIVQSSALVECINSIIRPYLNVSRSQVTQETLNLIMFYHNHRRYVDGKRKGHTPMEILTGKKQKKDWIELLFDAVREKDPTFLASSK